MPGGKIEANQTSQQAVIREVFEETGIDLLPQNIVFLHKLYVRDVLKDFVYYIFTSVLSTEPEKIILAEDEHTEHCWLTPEQALKLSLVPGEDECLWYIFG